MKTAVVCGAGGFIGSHLVKRLKREGYWVRRVDSKRPDFSATAAAWEAWDSSTAPNARSMDRRAGRSSYCSGLRQLYRTTNC